MQKQTAEYGRDHRAGREQRNNEGGGGHSSRMEYEKQLNIQFHPSTIYHLHNHNHTVASSNAMQTKHVGWNQRLVHGNQTRSVRSAAGVQQGGCSSSTSREGSRQTAGTSCCCCSHVSFVVVAEKGACRPVPTTTRAERVSTTQRVRACVWCCVGFGF